MTQSDTNERNWAKLETPEHWGISIAQFQSTVFPKIEGCSPRTSARGSHSTRFSGHVSEIAWSSWKMGISSIVHVWNFKVTLLLPSLLSLYFIQEVSILLWDSFSFHSIHSHSFHKASGLWRPGLDPPITKHTIVEKQTLFYDQGISNSRNLMILMGIQCNEIGTSCDTQGMTCSAYVWLPKIGCLACASLIPHMHGTDLHPGNWKGFQQRRSALGM